MSVMFLHDFFKHISINSKMPVKMLPLYLSYGGDTTDTIRFRKLTVEDVTLGLFSLGLTVNDPLDPPDPQRDDEADGIPRAAGAIGHCGRHHGSQGQHNDCTVKDLCAHTHTHTHVDTDIHTQTIITQKFGVGELKYDIEGMTLQ